MVVRSSALVEDRFGSSFAGQFESYLGLEEESEFITAVRSCWAALWSTRALRYMATHDLDPADTAMAVLVQPLVHARVAGGGLSQTADGGMLVNATWGLGSSIAQGEVTPDRYELDATGRSVKSAGPEGPRVGCGHAARRAGQAVSAAQAVEPCLTRAGRRARRPDAQGRGRAWACRSRSNGPWTMRGSRCSRRGRCTCRRRMCRTTSGCTIHASTAIRPVSAGARAGRA